MTWRAVKQQISSNVLALLSSSRKKSHSPRAHESIPTSPPPRYYTGVYPQGCQLRSLHFWAFEYYAAGHAPKGPSQVEVQLHSLFDSLRDDDADEKDKLELDSTMQYITNTLKVKLDDAGLFVVQWLVTAPSIGEITRQGYVDGWKKAGTGASHEEHASYVRSQIKKLSTDQDLFRNVYKHTFVGGRERDQKALSLENALIYWDMLFNKPGMPWKTANHDWLGLWKAFLGEKYTRSVNRDMWNMTLTFAFKTLEDETLSFWSADGAWPSVIDDFVEWCKEKGVGKADSMEVDDN